MEFPHMAAVGFNLADGTISWSCGGTLISDSFVLSTAVCSIDSEQEWVRLGELNLKRSDDGATPLDRRVIERIIHPERKSSALYHDIALLRLESPVPFNDRIRPACIHTAPSTDLTEAIATGWGAVDWGKLVKNSSTLTWRSIFASFIIHNLFKESFSSFIIFSFWWWGLGWPDEGDSAFRRWGYL